MMACHVAVRPWSQQSTRWRKHHCSHMLLLPPRAAATARAGSADIVPHVCAAGESTVDAPLTSWLPSGAHGTRVRTTVEEVALTTRRSLVPQEAATARPAWTPRLTRSRWARGSPVGRRGERGTDAVCHHVTGATCDACGRGAETALPMRSSGVCDRILLHVARVLYRGGRWVHERS